jgi:hypothetical protein
MSNSARLTSIIAVFFWTAPAAAQELGNRILGTLGLLAGSQPESGIYVADRSLFYSSNDLVDRNGHRIPVGLDLDARANVIGAQVTFRLPWRSAYMNASLGIPAARFGLHTEQPEASIDRLGFADLYVQPIKIGWKATQFDIVAGYSFYAPTVTPGARGGLGRGYWTHQFSLGGAVYFDRSKSWHVSELMSYDRNSRSEDLDLVRGDTFQFQGGAGKTLGVATMGLAGYGLWQVRDDRGSAVPVALRGARDRVFGLGPEIDIRIPAIRAKIALRYCHDVAVNARPFGQIIVVGLTVVARR